jgi:hypothetical protein
MLLTVYSNITPDKWKGHLRMPHSLHHMDSLTAHCLKNVAIYLRRTKYCEIRFTRQTYDSSLRPGESYGVRLDSNLPSFPAASHPLQLTGFVDAARSIYLRNRRYTTGYAFLLSGGAAA